MRREGKISTPCALAARGAEWPIVTPGISAPRSTSPVPAAAPKSGSAHSGERGVPLCRAVPPAPGHPAAAPDRAGPGRGGAVK